MKNVTSIAAGALVAVALGGCTGGGSDSDYCQELEKATPQVKALAGADLGKTDEVFAAFHRLAEAAPGDVEADWKTLDDAAVGVEKALDAAGIQMDDFAAIQAGEVPEGLDPSRLPDVATAFNELQSDKAQSAASAIEKHAKSSCKLTFDLL